MNGSRPNPLPLLTVADFGPTLDHRAEAFLGGKVFAMLHKDDAARAILPALNFAANDPFTYVFLHASCDPPRFENRRNATYEIPTLVAAQLLRAEYGPRMQNLWIRLCSCYGNLVRAGDPETLAVRFVRDLNLSSMDAYHGLIILNSQPPSMMFGSSVEWDPVLGDTIVAGPPGTWETVYP